MFAKDEKGYPFDQLALVVACSQTPPEGGAGYSCSDNTEKRTLFLSILLSLKTNGKGVKFQDITPIRATFTNTIANALIIAILFS